MLVESAAPRNDLDGTAEFRRRSRWPISEHVLHIHHGWQLLSGGCVDILNVSPYLLGSLRASLRLVALAEAARASVLIGTTQELNLGTAAVAHLGAAARILDYPSDNTGPHLYLKDVVKKPLVYEKSHLLVPEGPGLGLEIDEDALGAMTDSAAWTFGTDLAGVLDRTPSNRPLGQERGLVETQHLASLAHATSCVSRSRNILRLSPHSGRDAKFCVSTTATSRPLPLVPRREEFLNAKTRRAQRS